MSSPEAQPGPSYPVCGWKDGWYVTPHEVTWRELDAARHVNNAVYFTYFEWARTKFWLDLNGGGSAPRSGDEIGFVVARAECDFRRELGLAERIEIRTRVGEMRTSSLDFEYEVRTEAGELSATGKVVVVVYDWVTRSKLRITDELRERIRRFQGQES